MSKRDEWGWRKREQGEMAGIGDLSGGSVEIQLRGNFLECKKVIDPSEEF